MQLLETKNKKSLEHLWCQVLTQSECPDLFMEYIFIYLSTLFMAWTMSQGENGKCSPVATIWQVQIVCGGKNKDTMKK